jgi:anti-sigma B factor antagonist
VTLSVAGELDIATTGQLRARAESELAGALTLTLDLSGVTFIGAAGLGTLVVIQHLAYRNGTTVLLAGTTPRLRELVKAVGLTGHFTLTP